MDSRNPLPAVLVGIGLWAVVGCDGPTDPPYWTHQMMVYAALNPDSTVHPISVMATDGESTLSDVAMTIHRRVGGSNGEEWELVASWDSTRAADAGRPLRDLMPCRLRVGSDYLVSVGLDQVCMTPEAGLEAGGFYRVEVQARDRDTARGVTRVVGGFEIRDAVLSGGVEDPAELSASWTPSMAAHRYILSLRKRPGGCVNCPDGWYADVDATSVTIQVPGDAIDDAFQDPMMLDVVAFDEHLHAFLTTGHSGLAFSVPPVQNVTGGFGVVGSLRFRERPVEELP